MTRARSTLLCAALTVLAFLLVGTPAFTQTLGFSPADYGKAQLPARQSTGDSAAYIDANKGAFEPVADLDPSDPLAKLARPIGRLDVILHNAKTGEDSGASCTASLLPGNYVLTNHHCLPQQGDERPTKASILMDYLTLDGKGSKRFDLDLPPVEFNATLDYAIAKVEGDPVGQYGTVHIAAGPVEPGHSLLVIHHPLGRPKVMSRFRCYALKGEDGGSDVHHHCDTLAGSSGSLLIDAAQDGIALHKEGGLDPTDPTSYNTATLMSALVAASPILRAAAAETPVAATPAPGVSAALPGVIPPTEAARTPGALDTGRMNAILRGP